MDEFALIDVLRSALGGDRDGCEGIGHDGVVLRPGDGRVVVTDTMVEGVHFRRDWSTPDDVVWKLLASNVSDLWAMGARPGPWLLNATVDEGPAWVEAFARSGRAFCAAWAPDAALVGGDTTRAAAGGVVLSVTWIGAAERPAGRAGARAGEGVWIDGPVGLAAAGLEALRRGEGDDPRWARLVAAHRRPDLGGPGGGPVPAWVSAAVDVSDGLASDVGHVARASGVRVVLDGRGGFPGFAELTAAGDAWGIDPLTWQVAGGDDYVRCAVAAEAPGPAWTRIGHVEAGEAGLTLIGPDGTPWARYPAGYRHSFLSRPEAP